MYLHAGAVVISRLTRNTLAILRISIYSAAMQDDGDDGDQVQSQGTVDDVALLEVRTVKNDEGHHCVHHTTQRTLALCSYATSVSTGVPHAYYTQVILIHKSLTHQRKPDTGMRLLWSQYPQDR